jgi:hypothetical protein
MGERLVYGEVRRKGNQHPARVIFSRIFPGIDETNPAVPASKEKF